LKENAPVLICINAVVVEFVYFKGPADLEAVIHGGFAGIRIDSTKLR
jgi:hypothetical protein